MDLFLAQFAFLSGWGISSVIAGLVGVLGLLAVFFAVRSVGEDHEALRYVKSELAGDEPWVGCRAETESGFSKWLSSNKLNPNSAVAYVIRACWVAWLSSRAATVAELHAPVVRREREKIPPRLSSGIAALLLVIGIAGTLTSVSPILKNFGFEISRSESTSNLSIQDRDSGDEINSAAGLNVADNVDRVNALMRNLSKAFIPSVVALCFTIVVVSFRGFYSLKLSSYMLELDHFILEKVMPNYRITSAADAMVSVTKEFSTAVAGMSGLRDSMRTFAENIGFQKGEFSAVIDQLKKLVDSIQPSLSGLEESISGIRSASNMLDKKSTSIAQSLTRNLGKKSPLYGALAGFEDIFFKTNEHLGQLSNLVTEITSDQEGGNERMNAALDRLTEKIEAIGEQNDKVQESIASGIADLNKASAELPRKADETAREILSGCVKGMESALKDFVEEQRSEGKATRSEIVAGIGELNELASNFPKEIEETAREVAKSGVGRVRETVADFLEEQRTESREALRAMQETTETIANSSKAIPKTLEKLNTSLERRSKVEAAGVSSIEEALNAAKAEFVEFVNSYPLPSEMKKLRKFRLSQFVRKAIRSVTRRFHKS